MNFNSWKTLFCYLIIKTGDNMEEELFLEDINECKKRFGERIRSLRKVYEWTQEDLAEHTNLTVRGISDIENGLTDVKLSTILKLANAFEITISELVHFEEKDC